MEASATTASAVIPATAAPPAKASTEQNRSNALLLVALLLFAVCVAGLLYIFVKRCELLPQYFKCDSAPSSGQTAGTGQSENGKQTEDAAPKSDAGGGGGSGENGESGKGKGSDVKPASPPAEKYKIAIGSDGLCLSRADAEGDNFIHLRSCDDDRALQFVYNDTDKTLKTASDERCLDDGNWSSEWMKDESSKAPLLNKEICSERNVNQKWIMNFDYLRLSSDTKKDASNSSVCAAQIANPWNSSEQVVTLSSCVEKNAKAEFLKVS
jgi:hypothetical protein